MAAYVELYMDQGTTFNNTLNITDDISGAKVNIAGYTVRSQMRRSYYSANASATITCTILDASNGAILMSLPAANTSNIKAGRYLFDVETIDTNNVISRILEGIITVTPEITR
jgi:hypothetical protein